MARSRIAGTFRMIGVSLIDLVLIAAGLGVVLLCFGLTGMILPYFVNGGMVLGGLSGVAIGVLPFCAYLALAFPFSGWVHKRVLEDWDPNRFGFWAHK